MRSAIFALGVIAMPLTASATEEPPHTVLVEDGKFELRQYEDMIVAEVDVTGDMRRAGNSGFRPLAGYIFGDNTARATIDMTAPVTRQKSQKIEMTAPVTRIANPNDTWTVAFVMPKEWTLETLPVPNNRDVTLREEPGALMATVRFSGRAPEADFEQWEGQLLDWIKTQGYAVAGPPRYAGYNSPMVPGPFRRNEVMIPIEMNGQSVRP